MKKALIFIGILIGIFVLSIVATSLRPKGVLAYDCGCPAPPGETGGCSCGVSCGVWCGSCGCTTCGFDCGGGDDGGGNPPPPPPPEPTSTPTPTPSITPTPPFSLAYMGIKIGSIAENQVLNVAQILDAYPLYPTPTPKLNSLGLQSFGTSGTQNSSSPKSGGFSSIFSFLWKLFF